MSHSDKEQSFEVGGDGGEGSSRRDDHHEKRENRNGCGGNHRKKKKKVVSLSRLRKAKKQLHTRNKNRNSNPSTSIGGCFGNFCCFKQTPILDSPIVDGSPTSDPNSAEFTHELLRALIEKNDFYSKECNPHLDIECRFEN